MNAKQLDDVLFRLSVTKDESFEKMVSYNLTNKTEGFNFAYDLSLQL